jgi:hypothetical protein
MWMVWMVGGERIRGAQGSLLQSGGAGEKRYWVVVADQGAPQIQAIDDDATT